MNSIVNPVMEKYLQRAASITKSLSTFSVDEIVDNVIQHLPELFQISYIALFLYEIEDDALTLYKHNQDTELKEKFSIREANNVIAYAAHHNRPLFFENVSGYLAENLQITVSLDIHQYLERFCMVLPLSLKHGDRQEPIGVLAMGNRKDNAPYNELERYVACNIAEIMTYSISRARLFESANTSIDAITGMLRPQYFYENLNQEVYRAARYNSPLSLIIVDLDGFRQINNRLGNAAGDHVIEESAMLIHKALRNVDIVARENDSFLIVLPETKVNDAMIVAERLRKSFDQNRIAYAGQDVSVSISLGLVGHQTGDSPSTFLNKAKIALARACENGGNQIIIYDILAGG